MKLFFTKVITIFLITSVSLTLERSFVTVYLEDMTVKTTPAHYAPQKSEQYWYLLHRIAPRHQVEAA